MVLKSLIAVFMWKKSRYGRRRSFHPARPQKIHNMEYLAHI